MRRPRNSFLVKKSRNRLFYGKFRHTLSGMIVYSKRMDKGMGVEVMPTESLSIELLEQERLQLLDRLKEIDSLLEKLRTKQKIVISQNADVPELKGKRVDKYSPVEEKIKLFKSLFQGRQDVFARRFEKICA